MSREHERDLIIYVGSAFIGSFSAQFWRGDLWPTAISLIAGCTVWVVLVRSFLP